MSLMTTACMLALSCVTLAQANPSSHTLIDMDTSSMRETPDNTLENPPVSRPEAPMQNDPSETVTSSPSLDMPNESMPAEGFPCDATILDAYVGQPWSDIEAMGLPLPNAIRVVPENGAMTMDFMPDRLTVIIKEDGTLLQATCG